MMDIVNAQLQELAQIIRDSRPLLGVLFIDEERFYVCTTKIKKSSPSLFGNLRSQSCNLLMQLEELVEKGQCRLFGKVSIDSKSYNALTSALATAIKNEQHLAETPEEQEAASELIRAAQLQAANILTKAEQEAQRIINDAKRHVSS